jgi:phage/plasmid-like protein (TIGR03299 family)
MSDNIEVSGFQAAFVSRKDPGWHLLGKVIPEDQEVTTSEFLKIGHLAGWNVRLVDVDVPGVSLDRWATTVQAVVRDNPFDGAEDVLAFVGDRYNVFQNEDAFGFLEVLAQSGRWETAGSIKGGRVVFGSLVLPQDLVIDPQGRADEIRNYLLVATSHDGSMPLMAMNTPVRVVCQNTLTAALRGAKTQYKIRHTSGMEGKVQAARETLAVNIAYMDEFSKAAASMIETEITKAQFDSLVGTLYPKPGADAAKSAVTRYAKRVDMLEGIYLGTGDGPDTTSTITGTAWGAYNALTEALDWYRKPRKGNAESVLSGSAGFDPVINAEKSRIFAAAMALV